VAGPLNSHDLHVALDIRKKPPISGETGGFFLRPLFVEAARRERRSEV